MIQSFGIIFLSIFLEALPFVILGTMVSSAMEVFLPPDWLGKRFGSRKWYNYILAALVGVLFPVCECAIVPIMRRLYKKGMPLGLGITFMMATPIVNPVVLLSTFYAFNGDWQMVLGRGFFGFLAAIVIGLIISRYDNKKVLKETAVAPGCSCGHNHNQSCDHDHGHLHSHHKRKSVPVVMGEVLFHTGNEIMEVGPFLILGATVTATMQTFVSREVFVGLTQNPFVAIIVMMVLAFVLSLCSEADAFIAASFGNQFPASATMAFMVFGPMIDIKNTLMLAGSFRKAFVIRLVLIITAVVFVMMSLVALTGIELISVS